MKKLIILVMLLGVVTLQGFAREKYRILIRKTLDGKEIYLPMRKQHNGTWLKQWVSTDNVYSTKEGAESVIREWMEYEKSMKEYNNKKYVYIN
jgi:hypothetical protein